MNDLAVHTDKREKMDKLAAYVLFLERGVSAVDRMYPQYRSFVLSNQGKTRTQVKNELLQPHFTH